MQASGSSSSASAPTDDAKGRPVSFLPTDTQSGERTFDTKLVQATGEHSSSSLRSNATSNGARTTPFVDRARTMAWLRSTGRTSVHRQSADGWKTLEMQLKNGDGLMTVRARQSKDHMAISVGFSDGRLQAQAAAQLNQLHDLLQSQYDAPIDFSLMDEGHTNAHQHDSSDESERRTAAGPSSPGDAAESDEATVARRPRMPGAHHEWVG